MLARSPGRGAGRVRVEVPAPDVAGIALVARSLDIEAADADTGRPAEGARFLVEERRDRDGGLAWVTPFPPPPLPPTDSAGRTRLLDLGEGEIRLTPYPEGLAEPPEGTPSVEVDSSATEVRVPFRARRVLRWPLVPGGRAPPEGAILRVGEERLVQDGDLASALSPDEYREGRVERGEVVVEGLGLGDVAVAARAPDGSLARLSAPAAVLRGDPVEFRATRRLVVTEEDEDGLPVAGDWVALQTASGEAVAEPKWTDAEGRAVFAGIYPSGSVRVCPQADSEWGGAEGPMVDLEEADGSVEVVVGREFPAVIRFRGDGKARIPGKYSIGREFPGTDRGGRPRTGDVRVAGEDPDRGEVRVLLRAHEPGKRVLLLVGVPGRDPVRRELVTPPKGETAIVAVEL